MKALFKAVAFDAIFITASNAVASSNFSIRVPFTEKLSTWAHAELIYLPWVNVGAAFDCGDWTPGLNTILSAGNTLQERTCKISQEQEVILCEQDKFSGGIKEQIPVQAHKLPNKYFLSLA